MRSLLLITLLALASLAGFAQAPAATPVTTNDLKSVETPSTADKLKGDPGASLTGTAADIAVADSKKGLTSPTP
jgi:hypothetical protein